MVASQVSVYALIAVNLATFVLFFVRYDKAYAKWWTAQFAIYLIGCAASLTEPSLPWGIAILGCAAVIGSALTSRLYLMSFSLFGDTPW